jgi:hypothetical protein
VGVVAAEVIGLVDRDYDSDVVLGCLTEGVTVLPLHEIESVLCDAGVVAPLATHLGKDGAAVWSEFMERVRETFRDKTLAHVVSQRVRARVGDLLDGAFHGSQVAATLGETSANHASSIVNLDLPGRTAQMFSEEGQRLQKALASGGREMLAVLPGKHLLNILTNALGMSKASELTGLVFRALNRRLNKPTDPLRELGVKLETALRSYLPERAA